MGWLKRLLDGFEEGSATLPPGKTSVSENLVSQYCKQRYKIESCREKGNEVDDSELEKYETLQKRVKRAGIDAEKKYQKFKAERKSLPKEKFKVLDDAEDILQEPAESEEVIVYKPVKRGEEVVTKRETHIITSDGAVKLKTVITIPVDACGKKLSSQEEIAGFCTVCDEAVCSEHAEYCTGFKEFPCKKLLCPNHTKYFTDGEGESKPFCIDHYNMKYYRQESVPENDSKREKKPKNLEKDDGRFEK